MWKEDMICLRREGGSSFDQCNNERRGILFSHPFSSSREQQQTRTAKTHPHRSSLLFSFSIHSIDNQQSSSPVSHHITITGKSIVSKRARVSTFASLSLFLFIYPFVVLLINEGAHFLLFTHAHHFKKGSTQKFFVFARKFTNHTMLHPLSFHRWSKRGRRGLHFPAYASTTYEV